MSASHGPGLEGPYPSARRGWYVIAVLFLLTLFSQLDRQLPALLVAPIRAEFDISDTAFSMAQGYAFAFVFTVMGLPLGRFVDRTNRRNLLIAGVALWSIMTILAGLVTSYAGFFLTRMGVGIGEAVLSPAAYSLIADYFRPERRGRAISAFYLSYAIGQGSAFAIGALLLRVIPETGLDLPIVGLHAPWRIAFLLAGMPGLLLAFVLLTVREPERREMALTPATGGGIAQDSAVRYVRANAAAYVPVFAVSSAMAIVGYTAMNWAPAFFARRFDLAPTSAGPLLGAMMMGAGLLGTFAAGTIGDRLVRRRSASARLPIALAASVILVPMSLWSLAPQLWMSMAMLGVMMFGLMLGLACVPAIAQDITPNRMRGQVVAAYAFVAGIIGIAIAPTLVALMTDHLFRDEALVGHSLAAIGFPAALLGAIACRAGVRPYVRLHTSLRGGTE